MPPWLSDSIFVALITGALGIIGGRISVSGQITAARIAGESHERELLIAPYAALATRVEQLETEASDQRVEADTLRTQVTELRIEVANLRADNEKLMAFDRQWRVGWDKLRDSWDNYRANPEPPDYPIRKESI